MIAIVASIAATIPAFIAVFSNDDETQNKDRLVEAKSQLTEIVDLMLAQDNLEVDLLKLKYRPEGKLKNVYGFLKTCHPNHKNLNLMDVSEISDPRPLFKWGAEITSQKETIKSFFIDSPCLDKNEVKVFAVYANKEGHIAGWWMDLAKKFKPLE